MIRAANSPSLCRLTGCTVGSQKVLYISSAWIWFPANTWTKHSLCITLSGILQRSEEHTSELQSLMRISYAVFCLKQKQESSRCTQIPNSTSRMTNRQCTKNTHAP